MADAPASGKPGCAVWILGLFILAIPFALYDAACGPDDEPSDAPSRVESNPSSESGLLTCPKAMEVIAERRGGGFVQGVDAEYDARMDWDGDGVSCE